jgi:hypothetical protein
MADKIITRKLYIFGYLTIRVTRWICEKITQNMYSWIHEIDSRDW